MLIRTMIGHSRSMFAAVLVAGVVAFGGAALAEGGGAAIQVTEAWSRSTPPGAPTAVGYLTVRNTGRAADRLRGGSTPVARTLEIHQTSMVHGVMRMRPVIGGVAIPAGGTLTLKPGGYHLMLSELKHPFRAGKDIPVVLRFSRAGAVRTRLHVRPATYDPHNGRRH